jgi:hypothetical protein
MPPTCSEMPCVTCSIRACAVRDKGRPQDQQGRRPCAFLAIVCGWPRHPSPSRYLWQCPRSRNPSSRRSPAARWRSAPSMSRSRRCPGIPPTGTGSTTTTAGRSTNSSLSPTLASQDGSAASIRSMPRHGFQRMRSAVSSPRPGAGSRTRFASKSICARA